MDKTTNSAIGFLNDIVRPTEFLEDRCSVRKAMLASMAVSSLADHVYHACPEIQAKLTVNAFRAHLAKQSPSFDATGR